MNKNEKDNDSVLAAIKDRDVKMRSHGYFVARAIGAAVAAAAVFILVFFVATFMIFSLQLNGGFYATQFGPSGWLVFLGSLPWSLLLLSIVLILILWILLRRYAFVYHQPFLYVLLLLVVVISLSYFLFSVETFHDDIYRYVERNPIPFVSGVYEVETTPMSGVYRGEVVMLATSSFVLENGFGQTSTVLVATAAEPELAAVDSGDFVLIFGSSPATATIEASGVERIIDYQ